jgi:hypothetical protein
MWWGKWSVGNRLRLSTGARQGRGAVGNGRTGAAGRPHPCGVGGLVVHGGRELLQALALR